MSENRIKTKEFIIAVQDGERIDHYLHRANKIICRWINSHDSNQNTYIKELKVRKKGAILKDPHKGLVWNNIVAYRWEYQYEDNSTIEEKKNDNGHSGTTEGRGKNQEMAGREQETACGDKPNPS